MKKALLIALLSPFVLFAQTMTESSHHVEIQGGCLLPEKASTPLLELDFANSNAKWEQTDNFEQKLTFGYGEQHGKKGFYIVGPELTKKMSRDIAWQLFSPRFQLNGAHSLKGNILLFTNGQKAIGPYLPFRERYVNAIFWFAADGSSLGKTIFPVKITQNGYTPILFQLPVPEKAVEAQLSLGANTPDIDNTALVLISYASVHGLSKDGGYFTDAFAVMPPVRGVADCSYETYEPAGSSIAIEVAYASDDNGVPKQFSAFAPYGAAAPKGTAWTKYRVLFKTDGKACPILRSMKVGNRLFSNWNALQCTTLPRVQRISKSPSANPAQPLIFSISNSVPVNGTTLKVVLDGEEITKDVKRSNDASDASIATFSYTPKEPFAMRKVHKAVVSIADIYGNATETPLYFFFDEPLDKGVFSLRKDGQMLLDGQPFFPIAAPYVIPLPINDHNLDNAFTWLKNVGFNTVYSGRNAKYGEYMDKVAKYGMKMYVMPGNSNGANCNNLDEMLENIAREYRHPAVLAWYIGDDTASHNSPEEMMRKNEAIKAVDPYHLTVQADAMHALHPFAPVAAADDTSRYRPVVNFADSFRVELYPVRDDSEKNARECVPTVIDDMKTILRDNRDFATSPKHIWAVVQYFEGWTDTKEKAAWKRFPTWQELRAMTWGSIIHGARGMQWYSYRYETKRFVHGFMYKEETRENIKRLVAELTSLVDVINLPDNLPAPPVAILSGPAKDAFQNDAISIMARKHGDTTYVFALNSAYAPVKARIALPGFAKASLLFEGDRTLKMENGAMVDEFQPYDIHIYRLEP
ncbi:MAG: hypothetical protein IKP00_07770 [Victivallales bacterium]|nr:hypothetical protein [Victivallales bacterium]